MPYDTQNPLPIAVLISGGGTTLGNLLEANGRGELPVTFALVVSSNPAAKGLALAESAGVPTHVVQKSSAKTAAAFSDQIFGRCREAGAELIVMGGFLKHVLIPPDFANRVMNIHPGLIPAFCGQGFYGQRVHQAVLDYGAKVSGCTVHFVDDDYDHGPIILQQVVDVHHDDTASSLAQRVFQQECLAYPEAIRLYAAGRLQLDGRIVRVRPPLA